MRKDVVYRENKIEGREDEKGGEIGRALRVRQKGRGREPRGKKG